MRRFEFKDDKSYKFWQIELTGSSFNVQWGRIGTSGQEQTKEFATPAAAQKEHHKLVAEKLKKGYIETTRAQAAPPSPGDTLASALAAHPDDLGAVAAYIDWLLEQGDPRGEFMQVQLALENGQLPPDERKNLQNQEQALLKKHARQWLGGLGRFLYGNWSGPGKPFAYRFKRGWLDSVRILVGVYEQVADQVMLKVLAQSPEARLLTDLEASYDMHYHPFDFDEFTSGPEQALTEAEKGQERNGVLSALLGSPYLKNLRTFRVGFFDSHQELIAHSTMVQPFEDCTAQEMIQLLAEWPRLEELYLNTDLEGIETLFAAPQLGQLRVFQFYFGNAYDRRHQSYPLDVLAQNKALGRLESLRLHPGRDETLSIEQLDAVLQAKNLPSLTHLQFHMTDYGNAGCERIVQSGILGRLKILDIGHGNMNDEGAAILARCPDLKHLDVLDVSRNCLTEAGIAALQATGIQVIAANQHDGVENEYLYEVDME